MTAVKSVRLWVGRATVASLLTFVLVVLAPTPARAQSATQINQIFQSVIALRNSVNQQQQTILELKTTVTQLQTTLAAQNSYMTQTLNRLVDESSQRYYVTAGLYDGAHALTACQDGFHTASVWEIFQTAQLDYGDFAQGTSFDDSGSGPPTDLFGWVRTGRPNFTGQYAGEANCNSWSSASPGEWGTIVGLHRHWNDTEFKPIDPWTARTAECSEERRVWCVED